MGTKKKKKHKKRRSHKKQVKKLPIKVSVTDKKEQSKSLKRDDMETIEVKTPPIEEQLTKENTGQEDKNKPEKKSWEANWLWAGATGGFVMILILCLIALWKPEFRHGNYYVCEDPSALKELLSANLSPSDSISITQAVQEETERRKDLIEDLLDEKVIVSSDTFASNISGYYNTLIGVLSAILIILNLVGYFSWRSNANASLEQKQRELEDAINKIDDRLESNLEEILRKNQVVRERLQSYLRELLEQNETLTDEEWDKLHLLLAQYKKEEVLKAINNDNDEDNNGEIEA